MTTSVQDFSDDPVDGSAGAPDRLGRNGFVQTVAVAIGALAGQRASTVIGLVGPWGSGKTSVIQMVRGRLQTWQSEDSSGAVEPDDETRTWTVVEFNPWFFQDLASLQWGFLSALYDGVASVGRKRAKKVRATIQTFGQAIAPAGAAGSLIGLDLSGIVRGAADLIGPDQSVSRQQASLEKLLRSRSEPVLIVLDDLDRLSPDELLMVFKLIRLVGRLPFVHYLIAYDEDTLLDVLSRTGLVGMDEPHRAGAYLEKMIQLRLDVPPLRQFQVDKLIDEAVEEMARSVRLQMDRQQQNEFAAAYEMHLRRQLATPRLIKRYVAQVEALYPPLADEVDAADFLLLTWIKVAAPRLYAVLPSEKATLTGPTGSLMAAITSQNQKPTDLAEHWDGHVEDGLIDPDSQESVVGVLGRLFPRYDAIRKGVSSFPEGSPGPKKIAHPDYFDRYFALEVPGDDILDSTVDSAYQAIMADTTDGYLQQVEAALRENTRLAAGKLEDRFERNRDPNEALTLLLWLAARTDRVPNSMDLLSPQRRIEGLCARLYLQLEPTAETIAGAVEKIAALPSGLELLSVLTRAAVSNPFLGAQQDIQARKAAYPAGQARFGQLIREAFVSKQDSALFDVDDRLWRLVWDWRVIAVDEARNWLNGQFDARRWSCLDAAARLVSTLVPLGVETPRPMINELDLNAVEELIGLDRLIAECQHLPPLPADERVPARTPATPETTRNYVRGIVEDLA